MNETRPPVLEIRNLKTHFDTDQGIVRAVDDISFSINRGEVLGLVGESGSGKSITGYSILGVIDPPGEIVNGQILYAGADGQQVDLVTLPTADMRRLRGDRIAMILQDPMMSLNPSLRIGTQLTETVRAHRPEKADAAYDLAVEAMQQVGIPDARRRLSAYPHEFSGGMRQRIAIAMALINKPDLIIADEPTTALDVTTQAQILYEVQTLSAETGTAWLWITHDLAVVAGLADRLAVMYAGRIVELGETDDLLDNAAHPYTRGLIASTPGEQHRSRDGRLYQIPGNMPSLRNLPEGCAFRPRCNRATAACAIAPDVETAPGGRQFRCFNPMLPA